MKRFLTFFFLLFLLFFTKQLAFASAITSENILRLANQNRINSGLYPLETDPNLEKAAERKAVEMLSYSYFEHFLPDGRSPWDFMLASGYDYQFAAENLAMDFRSAEGAVNAWMASGTHRENILDSRYEDIGVGVVKGVFTDDFRAGKKHETIIIVQMFGAPKKSFDEILISPLTQIINRFLGL